MRNANPDNRPFTRPMRIALVVGVDAAIVCIVALLLTGAEKFFQAYLYAYLFVLGISLGLEALLLLHFLVSTKWGLTIRRIGEAAAGSLWAMAILFIPILFGMRYIYPWTAPAFIAADPVLLAKAWWLNVPFFIVRAIIYFAIWIGLALIVNRMSAQVAASEVAQPELRARLRGWGAGGLILYGLTVTFASIDWLMSIEPLWYSTAFGLITMMAQVLSGLAFAVLILNVFPRLSLGRHWEAADTPIPYRDLGSYMLVFVMGWTYVAYFQMLIQWAGNLPYEVTYYIERVTGGWNWLAIFIVIFQFALPFAILIFGRLRHSLRALAWLGGLLLFTNLVYMFWQVKPAYYPGVFAISVLDVFMPFALGGLWLGAFFFMLMRRPPLTETDAEALLALETKREAIP